MWECHYQVPGDWMWSICNCRSPPPLSNRARSSQILEIFSRRRAYFTTSSTSTQARKLQASLFSEVVFVDSCPWNTTIRTPSLMTGSSGQRWITRTLRTLWGLLPRPHTTSSP